MTFETLRRLAPDWPGLGDSFTAFSFGERPYLMASEASGPDGETARTRATDDGTRMWTLLTSHLAQDPPPLPEALRSPLPETYSSHGSWGQDEVTIFREMFKIAGRTPFGDDEPHVPWTSTQAFDAAKAALRIVAASAGDHGFSSIFLTIGSYSKPSDGTPAAHVAIPHGAMARIDGIGKPLDLPVSGPLRAAIGAATLAAVLADHGHTERVGIRTPPSATARAVMRAELRASVPDDALAIARFLKQVGLPADAEAMEARYGASRDWASNPSK